MTEAREPLATVQEAVEPATAASPAAKPAAPVTGAPAQNENAYSEIQRRAKAGSFCFGTDDDVKPAALEFSFEGLSDEAQRRGFSVEPAKGTVEPGATKAVTVSFAPSGRK